jgi:hypothetical protein
MISNQLTKKTILLHQKDYEISRHTVSTNSSNSLKHFLSFKSVYTVFSKCNNETNRVQQSRDLFNEVFTLAKLNIHIFYQLSSSLRQKE